MRLYRAKGFIRLYNVSLPLLSNLTASDCLGKARLYSSGARQGRRRGMKRM